MVVNIASSRAGSFPGAFDGMLEFQNCEIDFDGGFRIAGPDLVIKKPGNKFAASLEQRLLLGLHSRGRQRGNRPGKFPDFCKGLNDREGRDGGLLAFFSP